MGKMLMLALMLIAFLTGCMPFRYYPLPVSASEARSTVAPIATAASNLGYRYWRWDDSVSVEPDANTRITYMFNVSGNYIMCVTIKDKNISGGLDAAFAT